MSKLSKLKSWVSLPEAAKYLSTVLEEPVSVRDLYVIALDGNLVISVGLPSSLLANPVEVFPSEEIRDAEIATREVKPLHVERLGPAVFGQSTLYMGIFDLSMLGGEVELLQYHAWTPSDAPYDSISFDETILRDQTGSLLRPLTYLWSNDKHGVKCVAEEIPWFGTLPDDAQLCVRVAELDRLVSSMVSSGSELIAVSQEVSAVNIGRVPKEVAVGTAPSYLDPTHSRFSRKLAAAVRAWLAVEDFPGRSPKEAIEDWLLRNADELGLIKADGTPNSLGISECAKVANWQPAGGAPKTST